MEELNDIFSFDERKIAVEHNCVRKKTNLIEYKNLIYLKKILNNYKLLINNKYYQLTVPHVYDYQNGIIKMEYFNGHNLELLLRNRNSHNYAKNVLNCLVLFLIENNIRWLEFAPRNVLLNEDTVCLVDFEKPLDETNNEILFLRNHVYEEYISFIFKNERIFDSKKVFTLQDNEDNYYLNISNIKIKRLQYLAKVFYNSEYISYQDYLFLYEMITDVETPYIDKSGNYIFPRINLSKLLKDKEKDYNTYINYAKYIINNCTKKRILK